jgi:tetratricopeptide (TPR) repeat protein
MASSARIEELEKKFNENPRRYFAPLANEYRKAGDVQQAIAICRTYVPQQPGHMSGHIVFGQALFEAGDHDEARGVFEAALGLDPENLIALRHLGDIAREHGEVDTARSWYRRVLNADPRNDEVAALLTSVEADQAAAADASATWMEINPEQTLELPPDLLAAASRDLEFGVGEPPRSQPNRASAMGELFAESPDASEAMPSADAMGLESLEFGPPSEPVPDAPPSVDTPPPYVDEAAKTVPTFVVDDAAHTIQTFVTDEAAQTIPTFATETMAELYVQQGFYEQALAVYRHLLTQHPGDPKLADRMEQLRRESAETPPRTPVQAATPVETSAPGPASPVGHSVREFFSDLALRRPRMHAYGAAVAPPTNQPVVTEPSEAITAAPSDAVAPVPVSVSETPAVDPGVASVGEAPVESRIAEGEAHAEPSLDAPVAPAAAASVAPADDLPMPRVMDGDVTDAPFHETYSAEFGASALVVPTDRDARPGLVETSDDRVDAMIVRPSGETDPLALGSIGRPSGFSVSESSEFDVTAYDAGDMAIGGRTRDTGEPASEASGSAERTAVTGTGAGHAAEIVSGAASDGGLPAAASPASAGSDAPAAAGESTTTPAGGPTQALRAAMQTGSVNVLFPQHPVSAPDEAAAAALSSAFGGPSATPDAPAAGRAARPARDELSLDSVFRESPAAATDPRRESTAFSFDQFFGETPPSLQSGAVASSDAPQGDSLDLASADAEQFSNWLSGLKKK